MESDTSRKRSSSKFRKRISGLSSFPQYVNKVQSKMNELRRQSLSVTADIGQPGGSSSLRGTVASESLSAKQSSTHNSSNSDGRKKRRRNVLSSCFDPQWSPQEKVLNKNQRNLASPRKRSTALPRILTPLHHHTSRVNKDSARETLTVRSANKQSSTKQHLHDVVGNCDSLKTQEDMFSTTWSTKLNPHRLPAPPSQCLAALPASKSPLLTIPLHKPSGLSNSSFSTSTGSSTTSSNVSTPIPPSPSPSSFYVASKSSLSSNEHSPPVKPRYNHLPPISNNNKLTATHPVLKTSSLPQLRSITPARKTPTHSLGRSPARSPVCSSYIMPVTKLNPIVRPAQPRGLNSANNIKRQDLIVQCKMANDSTMLDSSTGTNTHSLQSREFSSSTNKSVDVKLPPTAAMLVSIVTDSEQNDLYNSPSNDVTMSVSGGGDKELMIPIITIRSATPIKTPSEDDDSAISALCQQLVFNHAHTDTHS